MTLVNLHSDAKKYKVLTVSIKHNVKVCFFIFCHYSPDEHCRTVFARDVFGLLFYALPCYFYANVLHFCVLNTQL